MASRTLARALLRPSRAALASPGARRLLSPDKGLTNGGDPTSRVMQIRKLNDGINRPFAENEFAGGDRVGGGYTPGGRMGGSDAFAVRGGDRVGGGFAGGDWTGGNGGFGPGGWTGGNGGFTAGGRTGGNGGFGPGGWTGGNGGFTAGGRTGGNGGFTAGGRTGRFNMDLLQPTGQRVKRDVLHITQKGKKTFVTVTDVKGNRKAGASAGCLEDGRGGPVSPGTPARRRGSTWGGLPGRWASSRLS